MKFTHFSDVETSAQTGDSDFPEAAPAARMLPAASIESSASNPFARTPVAAITLVNLDDVLDGLHARLKQDEI